MQPETGSLPTEAQRPQGVQPMASSNSNNTPRSLSSYNGGAPETLQTPSAAPGQKARVLVSGPGDLQKAKGARIACLECRGAKIKCSAPTDGNVPCKRCIKHGKECLFEKHKRGRKPNKRFSVPGSVSMDAGGSQDGDRDLSDGGEGDTPRLHTRARSSEGLRDSAASAVNFGRPTSSGQLQHGHQPSRDAFFGSDPMAEGEQRFRSWSNAEPPMRGLDSQMQPWQYPPHAHLGMGHPATAVPQAQTPMLNEHSHMQHPHQQPLPPQHHFQYPASDAAAAQGRGFHGAGLERPVQAYALNGAARAPGYNGNLNGLPLSASASAPSSLHQLARIPASDVPHQPERAAAQLGQYQQPPLDQHGRSTGGDYGASANRWKESVSSNNASSPRNGGVAGASTGHGSPPRTEAGPTSSSASSTSYGHNRNRSYGQGAPAPSHNYQHWDSQLGSERSARSRLEAPRSPNGHGGKDGAARRNASGATGTQQDGRNNDRSQHAGSDQGSLNHARSNSGEGENGGAASAGSSPQRQAASSPSGKRPKGVNGNSDGRRRPAPAKDRRNGAYGAGSSSQPDDADVEFDDEQDELEDDADAARDEHDNVLSNPLKLLAQASDAAAARIEGGRLLDATGRNSLAAAETMGLLSTSSSSSRMAMSAAVNLTGLGRPMYGRGGRADEMMPPQSWSSTRTLPPLVHQDHHHRGSGRGYLGDTLQDRSSRLPAFLGTISRSKSYPAADPSHTTEAAGSLDEGDRHTPSEHALSAREADHGRLTINVTPSTTDHDAWEYREGKAQTRRGYANSLGAGASPGTMSHGGQTVSSAASANFPASAHQRTGESPTAGALGSTSVSGTAGGGTGEAGRGTEDLRASMTGKRKRSRSRLARGIGRKRRLTDRDTDAEGDVDGSYDEGALVENASRGLKDKQVSIASVKDGAGSGSGGEAEAGASRKGYFNLSLFHSKNDDEEGLDPVELGLVELKEVERLFDLFFARINPILDLFDPFLHSVSFVRMRSAFLTTVISCMAARFGDTSRDAKIATVLDKHWQNKLLPMILLGGYKSVEISQAFLILTTYSRPTSRLVDDRSWQYLGFAIRTATEVGVNRKVTPSESLLGNEQVCRRLRNRERLWFNLFLYDRTLSAQTGRPWTISEDRMIVSSSMWHRQDFALPEDVSLVSLIKLRRIAAQHSDAFDNYLSNQDQIDAAQAPVVLNAGEQSYLERRLAGLEFFRKHANADLEKWKQSWCINTDEKIRAVDTSTAAGKYLVRWAPTAKLFYYHSRLIINSLVLGTTEQHEDLLAGSSASVECWTSAISLIDTVLNDFDEDSLVAWSNDRVVMAVYAAVSALRLTNLEGKYPFADKETAIGLVRRLSAAMTKAGKTPRHRNGSATPYGRYLKSVLAIFEPEAPRAGGAAQDQQRANAQSQGQTPGRESENAGSVTTSSHAAGDGASPSAAAARDVISADHTGSEPSAKTAVAGSGGKSAPGTELASNGGDAAPYGAQPVPTTLQAVSGNSAAAATTSNAGLASSDTDKASAALASAADLSQALGGSVAPGAALGAGSKAEPASLGSTSLSGSSASSASAASPAKSGGNPADLSVINDDLTMLDATKLAEGLPLGGWTPTGPASTTPFDGGRGPDGGLGRTVSDDATAAALSVLDGATDPNDPVAMTIATAAAAAGVGEGGGVAVDDPESIDRLWDCLTAFEPQGFSGTFWQPPSTWNMSGGGGAGGSS